MRRIKEETTLRLGRTLYKPGDEDKLYDAIDPQSAQRHVEAGNLEGDWSGARGNYRRSEQERRHDAARSLLYQPQLLIGGTRR